MTAGAPVNLERAVTPHTRLGGHLMQGHVDGVGTVVGRTPGEHWEVVRDRAAAPSLARYVVEKGSIAVDGVSLTVSAVSAADIPEPWFEVSLIPTTLRETTLGSRAPGEPVNLEVDVIAKYVERLLGGRSMSSAPGTARHASRPRSPRSRTAGRSSSSTTRTARTRAT